MLRPLSSLPRPRCWCPTPPTYAPVRVPSEGLPQGGFPAHHLGRQSHKRAYLREAFPRRRHREFAMLDALDADQGIGDFSDFGALPLHDQDFQTVIVIQMNMHARHDVALEVVLDVGKLPGKIPHMVVVHERNRCNRFPVGILTPFLRDKFIANQIAKRFRARSVFAAPNDLIEVVEKVMVQGYAETNNLLHRVLRFYNSCYEYSDTEGGSQPTAGRKRTAYSPRTGM